MHYGLLGEKLSHSFSPEIHRQLGDYAYRLFEVKPEDLSSFMQSNSFSGINVTIPYKKAVIPFCHQLTPEAKMLQAVNTVIRQADGALIGHNTDYYGFYSMVQHANISLTGKKVLVLGSGGASNTVCAVLKEINANVVVISRSGTNHYQNIHLHADANAIVNTTPVGMYPNNGHSPIDLSIFPRLECVMDLIYNPLKTQLLLDAEARGIPAYNGLWMLVAQAKESAQWFTGKEIDSESIRRIYENLKKKSENIVLIGMPGCGKSTVGRLLAEKTGKLFVDTDSMIVEHSGRSIPDIFAKDGEAFFRKMETDVLYDIGKRNDLVIATGGGCVTKNENLYPLRQNGTIVWLQRSLETLDTEGRPLSQSRNIQEMFTIREPLYRHFADYVVDNNSRPEETISKIIQKLKLE